MPRSTGGRCLPGSWSPWRSPGTTVACCKTTAIRRQKTSATSAKRVRSQSYAPRASAQRAIGRTRLPEGFAAFRQRKHKRCLAPRRAATRGSALARARPGRHGTEAERASAGRPGPHGGRAAGGAGEQGLPLGASSESVAPALVNGQSHLLALIASAARGSTNTSSGVAQRRSTTSSGRGPAAVPEPSQQRRGRTNPYYGRPKPVHVTPNTFDLRPPWPQELATSTWSCALFKMVILRVALGLNGRRWSLRSTALLCVANLAYSRRSAARCATSWNHGAWLPSANKAADWLCGRQQKRCAHRFGVRATLM